MRLSIIIPCYNLEDYVERCITSVLDQDIPSEEYEIILIDDGSKDRTLEILNKYASAHSNIRVISQENKGVSAARNAGIEISRGYYIWFVDGDDWVTPRSLGHLLARAESDDVDILRFDWRHVSEYHAPKPLKVQAYGIVTAYNAPDFFRKKIKRKFYLVAQLLKREIIIEHQIRFLPLRMCEDVPFLAEFVTYSKKITAVNWDIYYYFNRYNSAVNTISPLRSGDTFRAYEQLRKIVFPYMKDRRFAYYMKKLVMIRIATEFRTYLHNGTPEEQQILLKSYKDSGLQDFSIVYLNVSLSKVLCAIVLKLHPDTFFQIWKKRKKKD